ncbi:hypothetical protein AB205_0179980 [Aquarana catesbeiana]|uniref:Uncharacterized protein n=1 Tax=Aquarana catesbeiana TaxID=8400 RepID=A0A2G9Q7K6_AQUCT|nr:hypothetical protein AB205_0179980 [Aquarana catesbeiana]
MFKVWRIFFQEKFLLLRQVELFRMSLLLASSVSRKTPEKTQPRASEQLSDCGKNVVQIT